MKLYQALTMVLDKIKESNTTATYGTQQDQLVTIMMNQERIAESLLVIGTLMQTIVSDQIDIEIMPPKGSHFN
jgi:hypothetical protein